MKLKSESKVREKEHESKKSIHNTETLVLVTAALAFAGYYTYKNPEVVIGTITLFMFACIRELLFGGKFPHMVGMTP